MLTGRARHGDPLAFVPPACSLSSLSSTVLVLCFISVVCCLDEDADDSAGCVDDVVACWVLMRQMFG